MKRIILSFFLLCFSFIASSQTFQKPSKDVRNSSDSGSQTDLRNRSLDSTSTKAGTQKVGKIDQYLIISHANDTTFVDTTLNIRKDYKFNYRRKDNFNYISSSNMGQSYNTLSYNFKSERLMPDLGARAKMLNYKEIEDVYYYHVPTPFTELFYKTGFEQGQVANGLFTVNTSEEFNFSIGYQGLRSLGNYQNFIASSGHFTFSTNYKTKNGRYVAKAHFVAQNINNEENGGLTDDEVAYFESGDPEFLDRGVFDLNFQDADNTLKGKRFHLDHRYYIVKPKDSTSSHNLNLTHLMTFEDKYFQFNQSSRNTYFGSSFKTSNLSDRATIENFHNQVQLNYANRILGHLQFNTSWDNYNYGYDQIVILGGQRIVNRLKGNIIAVGGKYYNRIGDFDITGDAGLNVSGDFSGNYITGTAAYAFNDDLRVSASINHNAKQPNYNFLLFQSDYLNYNWQTNFSSEKTQQLSFKIASNKIANIDVDYSTISDYAYFKKDGNGGVKPFQNSATITYLRVKLDKEIKFGHFALANTIMYQNVQDENAVFNVPEFITRNTLYYSNEFFKKALYLQTGFTFNYFSEYNMNAYDPLLGEFYVQNDTKIGNFPRLDFFIDAKIQTARIYFMCEHLNSSFTGYKFYSAPNYPYRDFAIRFGVEWNFFL
ncbi:putative porin [Formosa sp. S-31]|uniref:putative porin n=1 Tax=Formosa sp. S-31 TaxID=2790949 RepID=UPI003EC0284C